MNLINWQLARHPANYVIILLMILIPLTGVDIVSRYHSANYRPPQPAS
jgi:hypothetical protein